MQRARHRVKYPKALVCSVMAKEPNAAADLHWHTAFRFHCMHNGSLGWEALIHHCFLRLVSGLSCLRTSMSPPSPLHLSGLLPWWSSHPPFFISLPEYIYVCAYSNITCLLQAILSSKRIELCLCCLQAVVNSSSQSTCTDLLRNRATPWQANHWRPWRRRRWWWWSRICMVRISHFCLVCIHVYETPLVLLLWFSSSNVQQSNLLGNYYLFGSILNRPAACTSYQPILRLFSTMLFPTRLFSTRLFPTLTIGIISAAALLDSVANIYISIY